MKWGAVAAYLLSLGGVGTIPLLGWAAALAAVVAGVAWLLQAAKPGQFTEGESEPGTLVLDGHTLVIQSGERTESIGAKEVDCGWVEEPDYVVLVLHDGRSVSARVSSRKARLAVLSALGVSAADRVLSIPIYSRIGSVPGGELMAAVAGVILLPLAALGWSGASFAMWEALTGQLALGAGLITLAGMLLLIAVTTLPAWLLLAALRSRRAVIGTDGIVIEGAWRTVIPFSEVESVTLNATGAEIERKNGKRVRLPTGRSDPLYPTPQGEEELKRAQRLIERANEAMAAAGGSGLLEQKAAWLESGGRSLEEWRHALEVLGERTGDYRRPGITNDELLEIARDAARSQEQRLAAMFLIAKRGADIKAAEASLEACADKDLAALLRAGLGGTLRKCASEQAAVLPRLRVAETDTGAADEEAEASVDAEREDAADRRSRREASS